jgi:hypothetical protein
MSLLNNLYFCSLALVAACGFVHNPDSRARLKMSDSAPRLIQNPSPELIAELKQLVGDETGQITKLVEDPTQDPMFLTPADVEILSSEAQALNLEGDHVRIELQVSDTSGELKTQVIYIPSLKYEDLTKELERSEFDVFQKEEFSKYVPPGPKVSFSVGTSNMLRTDRIRQIMEESKGATGVYGIDGEGDKEISSLLEQMEQDRGLGIGFMLKFRF